MRFCSIITIHRTCCWHGTLIPNLPFLYYPICRRCRVQARSW
ncbi:hypothetical protein BN1708_011063 [Verticillium longisporum]|uniref:Uncharacterized protein n=1 Tax=Verticillium longisporum TaxID=100787 RepID=A0A0G4KWP7_VERLO|nr:hypothetical protein BN1708_011063 [Verticillium longisporum]